MTSIDLTVMDPETRSRVTALTPHRFRLAAFLSSAWVVLLILGTAAWLAQGHLAMLQLLATLGFPVTVLAILRAERRSSAVLVQFPVRLNRLMGQISSSTSLHRLPDAHIALRVAPNGVDGPSSHGIDVPKWCCCNLEEEPSYE